MPDLGSQEATSVAVKAYLFVLGLTFAIFSLLRLQSLLNLDRARYRVTRHIQLTDEDFMIELAPLGRRIAPHRGHRREYVNSREIREYCDMARNL